MSTSTPSTTIHHISSTRPDELGETSVARAQASAHAPTNKFAFRLAHSSHGLLTLIGLTLVGLAFAFPSLALDLVAFTGITGPLTSALTQISALGPGIKALVGFVGFVVALISLSAMRNFSSVLFYVGLAIFAAVGLVIAGAIMGAVI